MWTHFLIFFDDKAIKSVKQPIYLTTATVHLTKRSLANITFQKQRAHRTSTTFFFFTYWLWTRARATISVMDLNFIGQKVLKNSKAVKVKSR